MLSDAFEAQSMFPKMYTTTLMAGEKSGNMEEVLGRYIAFQRVAMTFRKKLLVSLVYPTLLISVVLIMMVFLVTYVVPEFAKLFDNLGAKLPTITIIMLSSERRPRSTLCFWRPASHLSFSCCGAGRIPIRAQRSLTAH